MNRIIPLLLTLLLYSTSIVQGAQQALETTFRTDHYIKGGGDPTGDTVLDAGDVFIAAEENFLKQESMNSELYGKTITNFGIDGTTITITLFNGTTLPISLSEVDFSVDYYDLINRPVIPTTLAALETDATHRVVTDAQIAAWNAGSGSGFSGDYNDLINKPTTITSQQAADIVTNNAKVGITSQQAADITANNSKISFDPTSSAKLAGIAAGAEVNVQSDWTVTDTNSDAYILHKPTVPASLTALSDTAWRVFYTNGSGVHTPLALGASGTLLKSNGPSTAPTFSAVGSAVNRDATDTFSNDTKLPSGAAIKTYGDANWGSGTSMTYPGAGIPVSIGSAWGTSYSVASLVTALQGQNWTFSGDVTMTGSATFPGTDGSKQLTLYPNTVTETGIDNNSFHIPSSGILKWTNNSGVEKTPIFAEDSLTNNTSGSAGDITDSTTNPIGVGTIELGHASDTTLSRSSAGVLSVEGIPVTRTIASGTSSLGTDAISNGTCATTVTTTATGTATTDVINWIFNADPTSVTGYNPSGNLLYIVAYPTANNVNFKVCNKSGSSITPGAIILNWKVQR